MTELIPEHLVYFDSNVFIYYIEGEPSIAEPFQRLFSELRGRTGLIVTSELTLAEVLAPEQRTDAMPLPLKRQLYLDLIVWSRMIDLKPVSRSILCEPAELRRTTRYRLPDAIHVVIAVQSGCRFFMSGDCDAKKLPVGMKHLDTNETGVRELIRHLNA